MTALSELIRHCPGVTQQGGEREITALHADSREVGPGSLFVALPGTRVDGAAYIHRAIAAGAVAVLDNGANHWEMPGVTRLIHPRPSQALAHLAAAWHGFPGREMRLVGVTGTNGKTTTVAMVEAILASHGERVGVIGTTGMRYPGGGCDSPLTTPDPLTLHRWLREMRGHGCTAAVLEVSSHSLDQHRVDGLTFEVGIFTNLTRDHLDYHREEDAYFAAKARLFLELDTRAAVINVEDPWGHRLAGLCRQPVMRYGTHARVDFSADRFRLSWRESGFRLLAPDLEQLMTLPVAGSFNIQNALAAMAATRLMEVPMATVTQGLARFQSAPGRMETLWQGQPFAVVVDYAHTPDALDKLIRTARALTSGRVIAVIGCGGDRDPGKRPQMGEIAARLADRVIVTDDNPRNEDPAAIRQAVLAGCGAFQAEVVEVAERGLAIAHALSLAQPGDAVLVAGKGHEQVQLLTDGAHPFDDRAVAREALQRMGFRGDGM